MVDWRRYDTRFYCSEFVIRSPVLPTADGRCPDSAAPPPATMRAWCTVPRKPSRSASGRRSRSAHPCSSGGWPRCSGVTRSTSAGGGFRRLGRWCCSASVERLVAVAVSPARDRAAAGAGDARNDRGRGVPALPQPAVRRPARALPRAGVAGTHVLGPVAFPAAVLLILARSAPEERFLHERFGAPYKDYTRRVRRWL